MLKVLLIILFFIYVKIYQRKEIEVFLCVIFFLSRVFEKEMSTVLYLVNKMITTLITAINKNFIYYKNGLTTNGQIPHHDLIIALFLFLFVKKMQLAKVST